MQTAGKKGSEKTFGGVFGDTSDINKSNEEIKSYEANITSST